MRIPKNKIKKSQKEEQEKEAHFLLSRLFVVVGNLLGRIKVILGVRFHTERIMTVFCRTFHTRNDEGGDRPKRVTLKLKEQMF